MDEEDSNQYEWQPLSLLTNLKKLSIKSQIFKKLRCLIPQMTTLTSLEVTLDGYSRDARDNDAFYNMTNLRELSLIFQNDSCVPLTYCPTNLTKLSIVYYVPNDYEIYQEVNLSPYRQLKALDMDFSVFVNKVKLLDLPTTLESLKVKAYTITDDKKSLHRCTHLTRLSLLCSDYIDTMLLSAQVLARLKIFGFTKVGPAADTHQLFSHLNEELEEIDIKCVDIKSILRVAHSIQRMSIMPETDLRLITHFSNLTQLKISKRYNNELTEVQQLTQLRSLTVNSTSPLDPAALTNLEYLSLNSSNDFSSYSKLTNLTYLKCIIEPDAKISDTLTLLTRLGQLQVKVSQSHLEEFTEFWHQLAQLTTLHDLHIASSKTALPFSDILLLRDLPRLTSLNVPVSCTAENFHLFTQLSNIQMLKVHKTNTKHRYVGPDSLDDLRCSMPYLRHVYVYEKVLLNK